MPNALLSSVDMFVLIILLKQVYPPILPPGSSQSKEGPVTIVRTAVMEIIALC